MDQLSFVGGGSFETWISLGGDKRLQRASGDRLLQIFVQLLPSGVRSHPVRGVGVL